jgi:hypothetical protein
MELEMLAPVGQRTLCRKAGELCLARIRAIRRRTDPGDPSLRRLLEEVERRDRLQLDEILGVDPDAETDDGGADPAAYFPSAHERFGEAPLDRESALYLVERLLEEAWRFFQNMARTSDREDARAVYTRIALRELGEVARLRTVIL